MSLGWGRLCKAFLRTIELVLKSNDPDPSLVPIKVTSIFKHLNSDMWSATDVASLSADYVVQRVSSKANVPTAGSVSHQTVEDLIRAMENL
jgi:glycine cleavage system protein P-like pyridoxal-binding family